MTEKSTNKKQRAKKATKKKAAKKRPYGRSTTVKELADRYVTMTCKEFNQFFELTRFLDTLDPATQKSAAGAIYSTYGGDNSKGS